MKIITWNCNMAFRKKAEFILTYKPDILIIAECEHPEKLIFPAETPKPTQTLWFGKNKNKGLAIFSYSNLEFRVLDIYNPDFKMIIPITVTGGYFDFNLFAVWAYNPIDKDGKYITQVWKAINYYDRLIRDNSTILIGDFNSNTIWDYKKHRLSNHSSVVTALEEMGIFSTYHLHHKQTQGKEQHPTYFMYRHLNKAYHIDYCFASRNLLDKLENVEIGTHEQWTSFSDHNPLIVSFKD
ncbi:MAG: endonuclease/exonuclease/phosphatase family protein [Ginsengibacter sp.]